MKVTNAYTCLENVDSPRCLSLEVSTSPSSYNTYHRTKHSYVFEFNSFTIHRSSANLKTFAIWSVC